MKEKFPLIALESFFSLFNENCMCINNGHAIKRFSPVQEFLTTFENDKKKKKKGKKTCVYK